MKVTDFQIEQINYKTVKPFIEKWHYSSSVRGLHIEHCFNLTSPDGSFGLPRMIGAMIYGKPAMPDVSKKYCEDNPDIVLELNRLCCIDDTPKNTESYFIGKTLRWLKEYTKYRVIISHSNCLEKANTLSEKIREYFVNLDFCNIEKLGCALGVHAGPGSLLVGVQEVEE